LALGKLLGLLTLPDEADRPLTASQRTAQKAATVRRDGSFFVSPWRRLAEALEAGEVVDVGGWEIKSGGRTSTLDSATGSRRLPTI